MSTKKNHELSSTAILEAVEALSDIADFEILPAVGIAEKHIIKIGDQAVTYKSVHWVHKNDLDDQKDRLKEIFKIVLAYLRDYYKKSQNNIDSFHNVEGIKNIMVLVGEAAKKLDRFTNLFNYKTKEQAIVNWKEYRQLQDFYLTRIAKNIDEGILTRWIYGLAQKAFNVKPASTTSVEKELHTKHVFVDLEAVKKDTEYELFFMRKEDGSRFYSPRLIRNIKLVCDFGDNINELKADTPLNDLVHWQDRIAYANAKDLYNRLKPQIAEFYEQGIKYKNKDYVECIKKTLMALLLASNQRHLSRNSPSKTCQEYFSDFLSYLRKTLNHREYQSLLAFPPEKEDLEAQSAKEIVQAICAGFYQSMTGYQEMVNSMELLLKEAKENISNEHEEAAKKCHQMWSLLGCNHTALNKILKRHANGPLVKVLDLLEENEIHEYDSLSQGNLPNQLFSLYYNERKIDCLRLPCPIRQEVINKATISDEFRGYLHHLSKQESDNQLLIFNFQDRTSWREYMRCKALEELQFQEDFENNLTVVTFPKDTEFYYQLPPYLSERYAEGFIKQLNTQVFDEQSGFYFPPSIKKALKEENFVENMATTIHRIFFHNKNILLQEHRLDFIELFYLFLELKIIDITKANVFCFSCKDCVDIGSTAMALMFGLVKLLNEEKLTSADISFLETLIYASPILVRERTIAQERFKRMLNAFKSFELVREEYGELQFNRIINEAFGRFYKTHILESMVIRPATNHDQNL